METSYKNFNLKINICIGLYILNSVFIEGYHIFLYKFTFCFRPISLNKWLKRTFLKWRHFVTCPCGGFTEDLLYLLHGSTRHRPGQALGRGYPRHLLHHELTGEATGSKNNDVIPLRRHYSKQLILLHLFPFPSYFNGNLKTLLSIYFFTLYLFARSRKPE